MYYQLQNGNRNNDNNTQQLKGFSVLRSQPNDIVQQLQQMKNKGTKKITAKEEEALVNRLHTQGIEEQQKLRKKGKENENNKHFEQLRDKGNRISNENGKNKNIQQIKHQQFSQGNHDNTIEVFKNQNTKQQMYGNRTQGQGVQYSQQHMTQKDHYRNINNNRQQQQFQQQPQTKQDYFMSKWSQKYDNPQISKSTLERKEENENQNDQSYEIDFDKDDDININNDYHRQAQLLDSQVKKNQEYRVQQGQKRGENAQKKQEFLLKNESQFRQDSGGKSGKKEDDTIQQHEQENQIQNKIYRYDNGGAIFTTTTRPISGCKFSKQHTRK